MGIYYIEIIIRNSLLFTQDPLGCDIVVCAVFISTGLNILCFFVHSKHLLERDEICLYLCLCVREFVGMYVRVTEIEKKIDNGLSSSIRSL